MSRAPSFRREQEAWAQGLLLIGVDEVGRGPLAGPVVAAAVAFPPHAPRIRGVRDSKILSAPKREALAVLILERAAAIGVAAASVHEITRFNIRGATALAMRRAVLRAMGAQRSPAPLPPPTAPYRLLVDGLPFPELKLPHDALVDGDALCYSIAAAAIVAKTVRDRLMVRLAVRHDGYGWASNMGYGTADHLAALAALGPTRHHRPEFSPIAQLRLF
jgi:ribonuclease HII